MISFVKLDSLTYLFSEPELFSRLQKSFLGIHLPPLPCFECESSEHLLFMGYLESGFVSLCNCWLVESGWGIFLLCLLSHCLVSLNSLNSVVQDYSDANVLATIQMEMDRQRSRFKDEITLMATENEELQSRVDELKSEMVSICFYDFMTHFMK